MGTIADALEWSGSGATLSMFVVSNVPLLLEPAKFLLEPPPIRTRVYVLDDDDGVLPGRGVVEYDFCYTRVPRNLETLLTRSLHAARAAGADVAWFGFEGSFHFGHLLSPDIASQIYAIGDAEGLALATDASLSSNEWRDRIARAGERVRSRPGPGAAP